MGIHGLFHAISEKGLRSFRSVREGKEWLENSANAQDAVPKLPDDLAYQAMQEKIIEIIAGLHGLHEINHRAAAALEELSKEIRLLRQQLNPRRIRLVKSHDSDML